MDLFLGVDLAWGDKNETGVIALERSGRISSAGWTRGVKDTVSWIVSQREQCPNVLCFVDAPLVVANEAGQRLCEKEVGQAYSARWGVSCNSTNRTSPRQAGVQLREGLEALEGSDWRYSDGTAGRAVEGAVVMECYPFATLVGAEALGYVDRKPAYKRRPRSVASAEWQAYRARECEELIRRLAGLEREDPPMFMSSHGEVERVMAVDPRESHVEYKHREDLIDAAIAAWTAAYWHRWGEERCHIFGASDALFDGRRATIVAPVRQVALTKRLFGSE